MEGARDQFFSITEEDFRYERCAACGALVLSPRPPPQQIGRYYQGYYTDAILAHVDRKSEGGRRPFGMGRLRAIGFLRGLSKAGVHEVRGRSLLDVGAGLGSFLRYSRDLGQLDARGVDFSDRVAGFARKIHQVPIDVGELRDQRYDEGRFDFVTAWHYLEHVYDPLAELREMHRVLKPGGVVMIETPTPSLAGALFGRRWMYLMPPTHLYHYRPKTMTAMLEQAGFEVLQVQRPWFPGEWAGSLFFSLGMNHFLETLYAGRTAPRDRFLRTLFFTMMIWDIPLGLLVKAIAGGSNLRVFARKRRALPELSEGSSATLPSRA